MSNYTTNYLKVVSKMYAPKSDRLRYERQGGYTLKPQSKYDIIAETKSDAAAILYEYFYEHRKYNHFAPTNDAKIGRDLSWTNSKVTRVKSLLKKHKYLLILKDTVKDGTVIYRTILNTDLIIFYETYNHLPDDLDIDIRDLPKDTK